jgi:hypothetical protein
LHDTQQESDAGGAPRRAGTAIALNTWNVGTNVPWTVSWTAEAAFKLRPSEDFPGLTDLLQEQRAGQGSPKFGALHVTRQRLGLAGHLCHVCGRRTLANDRYIFPVESGGFVTLGDESRRYAGNVPPLHLACARRAQRLCPHLGHAYAKPIAYPREPSTLHPRPGVPDGMHDLAKTLPPGLTVVFTCFRLFGPRFSAQIARLRPDGFGDA